MTSAVTMRQLLEAGVHFGHRTRRWNPKMRPFIFTERSGIHIIDLHQTMTRINQYYDMVRNIVAEGGTILFVGTKRQAQATIQQEAERCGMPFINQRWLGGTLTNWQTIKLRIDHLNNLERRLDAGEFRSLTKKEQLDVERDITKLNRRIGGIKTMKRLPEVLFIVDTRREELAVKEANKLEIPLLAMVDTNCNPEPIDHIIPSNDDAIRAVKLITSVIADAAEEGRRIREVDLSETGQVSDAEMADMEQYLGPSTLAKLKGTEDGDDLDEDGYDTGDDFDEMEEVDDEGAGEEADMEMEDRAEAESEHESGAEVETEHESGAEAEDGARPLTEH